MTTDATPANVGSNDGLGLESERAVFARAFPFGFESEHYEACAWTGFMAGRDAWRHQKREIERQRAAINELIVACKYAVSAGGFHGLEMAPVRKAIKKHNAAHALLAAEFKA